MIMMLRYNGDGKKVSFITGEIYKAKKISDDIGEGYAIFDEGEDWYRYGVNFVKKNFEELSSLKTFDANDFKTGDFSAQISHLA